MQKDVMWNKNGESEWVTSYKGFTVTVYDVPARLIEQVGEDFGHIGYEYEIWREDIIDYDSLRESYDNRHFDSDEAMSAAIETLEEMILEAKMSYISKEIEPKLLKMGLIEILPDGGRRLTKEGVEYCKRKGLGLSNPFIGGFN